MRITPHSMFTLCLGLLLLSAGCTKRYFVLTHLQEPLAAPAHCSLGPIMDELPADMAPGDKPTAEDIAKLKRYLVEELEKRELLLFEENEAEKNLYEIRGSVLEFKRGSGFTRFLIGFGAGSAKLTVSLHLVEKRFNRAVFSGNFTKEVSSWPESGDQAFRVVASDFAKGLKKDLDFLEKEH